MQKIQSQIYLWRWGSRKRKCYWAHDEQCQIEWLSILFLNLGWNRNWIFKITLTLWVPHTWCFDKILRHCNMINWLTGKPCTHLTNLASRRKKKLWWWLLREQSNWKWNSTTISCTIRNKMVVSKQTHASNARCLHCHTWGGQI